MEGAEEDMVFEGQRLVKMRLEYLYGAGVQLYASSPELACHLIVECMKLAQSANIRLSSAFYQHTCTYCGTPFLDPSSSMAPSCKTYSWKRHFLAQALAQPNCQLTKHRWVKLSQIMAFGKGSKVEQDPKKTKFLTVVKCLRCSAHTIFDTLGWDRKDDAPSLNYSTILPLTDLFYSAPPKQPKIQQQEAAAPVKPQLSQTSAAGINKTPALAPPLSKGLQKLLAMKAKKAPKGDYVSTGDLSSFLLDLNKKK